MKIFLKILPGVVALVVLIKFLTTVFIEPWVGKKIQAVLNEKNWDYIVEIDKVHLLMIAREVGLEGITIRSKREYGGHTNFNGEIASVKFKGIKLAKAIFKDDINIREVTISNSSIKGNLPFSGDTMPPMVSPLNIRIGKIFFDKINLEIRDTATAQAYSLSEGVFKVYDLQIEKHDTLSPGIVREFDFEADELTSVSADSLYALKASGVSYSATSNTLAADSFFIQPNYSNYDFTSRYKYQTDRIEGVFAGIRAHNISAEDYFKFESLISSFIEIGQMDVNVFRDKRKEFRHVSKPTFQDMIYSYPGTIRIDSVGLTNGNVTYTEHAEKANEPGSISFNEIHAKVYGITNDTIFKTESDSLELKGEALLMGKGRMTLLLKAKIFDTQNTFSLSGTLSGMEAKELNPMLEKNAYVYATSGKIEVMDFSFVANNTQATGKMTLLYHGLDLAIKNKQTDDTTAFKERFISLIANNKVMDSNPVPGEGVREGKIAYERDPEKFLFNYCFKSILSGIKSSLAKSPKERKNSKQLPPV